jgi:hypothetical protein
MFGVDDYKSGYAVPPEGEFEDSWQTKFYALLLCFGTPVESVDGVERPLPSYGKEIQWVRVRELYPRLAPSGGSLREVRTMYSRQQLADWLPDVDMLAADLMARLESWKFPAVPGSHCSTCPSPSECPLPTVLRRHAGEINTVEDAVEAVEFGVPFDLGEHRRLRTSTSFGARRLAPAELESEGASAEVRDGSRFGDEAPW